MTLDEIRDEPIQVGRPIHVVCACCKETLIIIGCPLCHETKATLDVRATSPVSCGHKRRPHTFALRAAFDPQDRQDGETWENCQTPDRQCDWCTGMSGWPHPGPHMKGGNALRSKEEEKRMLADKGEGAI